jgi:hypothetical protein
VDAFVAKVNPSGTALLYAGYIGGSGYEDGRAIAVDSSGNAYVTGDTSSTQATFPIVSGPDPTYNGGGSDAFVAKVNPTGTALTYAGYIGGSGSEGGIGIAVNASGDAFVTGYTSSDQTSFPVVGGPGQVYGGNGDAFVAKVHVQTTFPFHPIITYAGYIGGDGQDAGEGIAVDSSGNAYITGQTQSTQGTFPVLEGPDLTANGDMDAFVAKVAASGTTLDYAGYIGGVAADQGLGIAVDGSGNAFVTGITDSDETSFPVEGGPELSFNGVRDAFVAEVNAAGSALVFAGYLGGADDDVGTSIAVDGAGDAFIAGETSSTQATFPVSNGPDSTYNGGTSDGFVAEVAPSGTALLFAGYLGGAGADYTQGIALHDGNTYVIGATTSDQSTFPVRRGPDLTANGGIDAFVAEVHHVTYRPDGKIKRSDRTNYVGDDVYDSTGSGQTATAKIQRGTTTTFDVQEQNDGTGTRDGLLIRGPGNRPGFAVRYLAGLRGAKDITANVENGTYMLSGVAPGAARSFRIVISVGPQVPELAIRDWLVTSTSAHDRTKRDAVLARVLVVPGSG